MIRLPPSSSGCGRRLGSCHPVMSTAQRKGRRRSARSYASAIVLCSVAGLMTLYGNNDGISRPNTYFSGTTLAARFLLAAEKYDVADHEYVSKGSGNAELELGNPDSNSTSARSSVGERQMLKIVSSIVLSLPNHSLTYMYIYKGDCKNT